MTQFKNADTNGDGQLSINEFVPAVKAAEGIEDEKVIRNAFDRLDSNSDGFLSFDEIKKENGNLNLQSFSIKCTYPTPNLRCNGFDCTCY